MKYTKERGWETATFVRLIAMTALHDITPDCVSLTFAAVAWVLHQLPSPLIGRPVHLWLLLPRHRQNANSASYNPLHFNPTDNPSVCLSFSTSFPRARNLGMMTMARMMVKSPRNLILCSPTMTKETCSSSSFSTAGQCHLPFFSYSSASRAASLELVSRGATEAVICCARAYIPGVLNAGVNHPQHLQAERERQPGLARSERDTIFFVAACTRLNKIRADKSVNGDL